MKNDPSKNTDVTQLLIQWINSSKDETTWEDFNFIAKSFPGFDSYGEESRQGGENVVILAMKKTKITIKPLKKTSKESSAIAT